MDTTSWTMHEGRLYNYRNLILPPYCHLLMTRQDVERLLVDRGYDGELSRVVSEYVTGSTDQNQRVLSVSVRESP